MGVKSRAALAAVLLGLLAVAVTQAGQAAPAVFLPLVTGGRPPEDCDPAYPTVCLPSPPPDLNCPDVLPLSDFVVLPPDPHGFDRDRDGIGCETEGRHLPQWPVTGVTGVTGQMVRAGQPAAVLRPSGQAGRRRGPRPLPGS